MPIISVRDNENNRWKRNAKKKKKTEKKKGAGSYMKGWELNNFVQLQSMCKASLIFKLNLELALSIILKERKLYELNHMLQWSVDV